MTPAGKAGRTPDAGTGTDADAAPSGDGDDRTGDEQT